MIYQVWSMNRLQSHLSFVSYISLVCETFYTKVLAESIYLLEKGGNCANFRFFAELLNEESQTFCISLVHEQMMQWKHSWARRRWRRRQRRRRRSRRSLKLKKKKKNQERKMKTKKKKKPKKSAKKSSVLQIYRLPAFERRRIKCHPLVIRCNLIPSK